MKINLETALGSGQEAQPFDSQPLPMGAAFTFGECSAPIGSDWESKSCTSCRSPGAVSRIKRSFTLLEMTLVLCLIALIGALTALPIKKLINTHTFESEVSTLFSTLQEAQLLSAAYQTDITLDFSTHNKTLFYQFSTEEPRLKNALNQRKTPLSQVGALKFEDKEIPMLHLILYSGGRASPEGVVVMSHGEGRMLYIDVGGGHLARLCASKPGPHKENPFIQKPD